MDYTTILTDPDKLLIALPIAMMSIGLIIIIGIYVTPMFKKKKVKTELAKKEKEQKPIERINFYQELDNIDNIKNISTAAKKISVLAKKFFSHLFNMEHSFTYEEIKKEAENSGLYEIAEFSGMLSSMNFAKDTYSGSDLESLKSKFRKVLDLYEAMVEDSEEEQTAIKAATRIQENLKQISSKLSDMLYAFQIIILHKGEGLEARQFEEHLKKNYPQLFKKDAKDYKETVKKIEGNKNKIRCLIKLGYAEIKKGNTNRANGIYNAITPLLKELSLKDKEDMEEQADQLHTNIINLIGLKISQELIHKINSDLLSGEYSRARQVFDQLGDVYYNLPYELSTQIYKEWENIRKKFSKY